MSAPQGLGHADSLADILERVLDRGVVIAGDVSISLVGIELVTIKLRLLIASVDKAEQMGIDWWRADPSLSSEAARLQSDTASALRAENVVLRQQIEGMARRLDALGA
jgi:hypothetical protein